MPLPRLFAENRNMHTNYEFKARCHDLKELETILLKKDPFFVGEDRQIDTYFIVPQGRLKLREGAIENALIHYQRSDAPGAKQSDVTLCQLSPGTVMKECLSKALGILTVVDKTRKIYFVDNVKFHFDQVAGLGTFVEVEAIDKDGTIGIDELKRQCNTYAALFCIKPEQYIAGSYSDLLLAKKSSTG